LKKPDSTDKNPLLVVPVGTQVVTAVECRSSQGEAIRRSGTVGKIMASPQDNSQPYLIQFPDGEKTSLFRQDFAIRKQVQSLNFDRSESPDLRQYIIYKCVIGSRAFALESENSDYDRRGIFLPPAELHWSIFGLPEQIEDEAEQECYFELQKFLVLALKANPQILECLYSPLVEYKTELTAELLDGRSRFLSKLVYQTYNGYVLSQFRKLEQDLRTRGELKWKHVMHLIRLLQSGITILKDGYVPVRVEADRDKLLAIKAGELSFNTINDWRLELHKSFDRAFENSKLPDRPDYDFADSFLIKARRAMVKD
jgi:uncharacterized protein